MSTQGPLVERGAATVEFLALTGAVTAIVAATIIAMSGAPARTIGQAVGSNIECLIDGFDGGAGCARSIFEGGTVPVKAPRAGTYRPPASLGPATGIQRVGTLPVAGGGASASTAGAGTGQSGWQRFWSGIGQGWNGLLVRLGLREAEVARVPETSTDTSAPSTRSGFGHLLDVNPELGSPSVGDQPAAPQQGSQGQAQSAASQKALSVRVYNQRDSNITADTLLPSVRDDMKKRLESQYKLYGCLPTSVGMVMDYYRSQGKGDSASIGEIMSRFEEQGMWTSYDGSTGTAEQFSSALDPYGFAAEVHGDGSWDVAFEEVADERPVIAVLTKYPIGPHSVVITGKKDDKVFFNDPWTGTARSVSETQFKQWWAMPNAKAETTIYPYTLILPKR